MRRLEEIVESLEQGEVPLEDSIKMYEEGVVLSKTCLDRLYQTELKLKQLTKDVKGHFELLDIESEEE